MPFPTNLLWERTLGELPRLGKDHLTKVSTAITAGRPLSIDANGFVVHYATGELCLGIALESKASSLATTEPIKIDYVRKGDVFRATGTTVPAQANVGDRCDIDSAGKVIYATTTNKDVTVFNITGTAAVTDILVSWNLTVL